MTSPWRRSNCPSTPPRRTSRSSCRRCSASGRRTSVDAAGVTPGQAVLDVACGTGVVAREARDRLGGNGTVVGVDVNEAMLTVARRLRPDIDWRQGDAAELPFTDASFDVVLCQAALMFFPDRAQALREMARVAAGRDRRGAGVGSLDAQPAYGPFVERGRRHAGPEAVDLLSAYWVLGDRDSSARSSSPPGSPSWPPRVVSARPGSTPSTSSCGSKSREHHSSSGSTTTSTAHPR